MIPPEPPLIASGLYTNLVLTGRMPYKGGCGSFAHEGKTSVSGNSNTPEYQHD